MCRPVIGFKEDIENLGRREVEEAFRRSYGPCNLCIAIVGDTTVDEVYKLATKYFGDWDPSLQQC